MGGCDRLLQLMNSRKNHPFSSRLDSVCKRERLSAPLPPITPHLRINGRAITPNKPACVFVPA